MDTATNVALSQNIPGQIHVLVTDNDTRKIFGGFAHVEYVTFLNRRTAKITRTSIGLLAPDATPLEVANILIETDPGTPLVCDEQVEQMITGDPSVVTWQSDGHYTLTSVGGGTLEIFTPLKSTPLPKGFKTPPGVAGGQLF